MLLAKLKQEHGEPNKTRRSPSKTRRYIEDNYDEIIQAFAEGFTYKQMVATISSIIQSPVAYGNFGYYFSIERRKREKGYLVTYKLGAIEHTTWRDFAHEDEVKTFVETLAVKTSTNAGYKVKGYIQSVKKMSRVEYEKSIKHNNA